jgi:hypothetical protein
MLLDAVLLIFASALYALLLFSDIGWEHTYGKK